MSAKATTSKRTQGKKAPRPGRIETPVKMTLPQIVEAFLNLAMVRPEKEPRTQRQARDNTMEIIGFNKAQEQLRHILATHGRTPAVRDLGEVRNENQQRPMSLGENTKVWVAS